MNNICISIPEYIGRWEKKQYNTQKWIFFFLEYLDLRVDFGNINFKNQSNYICHINIPSNYTYVLCNFIVHLISEYGINGIEMANLILYWVFVPMVTSAPIFVASSSLPLFISATIVRLQPK